MPRHQHSETYTSTGLNHFLHPGANKRNKKITTFGYLQCNVPKVISLNLVYTPNEKEIVILLLLFTQNHCQRKIIKIHF
jgi:hypothetical protein